MYSHETGDNEKGEREDHQGSDRKSASIVNS